MILARHSRFATLKTFLFLACLGATLAPALAVETAAVFEFQLQHGDLGPGAPQKAEAEAARLKMVSERLRGLLAGRFEVKDIAPVAARAAAANLQACGDCADGFAQEIGADYAVTGVVYKVSELVLSINVYVHDAAASKPLTGATVDLRGNTDESWRRGIDYLYKNMLAARLEKLTK
jgi:hypothetical protein